MMPGVKISILRTNISIGLVSASIIAFQLVLMQMLSYVQWYHFAYMIISMALLGFGCAGTFLTVYKKRLIEKHKTVCSFLLFITAVFILIVVIVANLDSLRFDSLLVLHHPKHAIKLIITYLLCLIPFFTAALYIGINFIVYANEIGKVYFANLLGSGLGGCFALFIMQSFLPGQLTITVSIPVIIAFLLAAKSSLKWFGGITYCVLVFSLWHSHIKLEISQYKDLKRVLLLPNSKNCYTKNSAFGVIEIVDAPSLRFAPGVSLMYNKEIPKCKAVFSNGNWAGALVQSEEIDTNYILNYTTQALPYHLRKIENVLIVNAGIGENIGMAIANETKNIVALESNPDLHYLIDAEYQKYEKVDVLNVGARIYLDSCTQRFDLIQMPIIGNFYGNSGLNAIHTAHELTVESVGDMWKKLSAEGTVCISCWMDYPARNSYKILTTILKTLNELDVYKTRKHVMAVRSWSTITFVVSKKELTDADVLSLDNFCNRLQFDPLLMPGTIAPLYGNVNTMHDSSFVKGVYQIVSNNSTNFIEDYAFRINPVFDNKPFFYQNIRWKDMQNLFKPVEQGGVQFLELGYLLVLLTLVQIVIIAAILVFLPLFKTNWKSSNRTWVVLYFSGIGLAYMFIEIYFLQQFTYYFGEPVLAAAISIAILLISSALGSYYSTRLNITRNLLIVIPILIGSLALLISLLLPFALNLTIADLLLLKLGVAIIAIGSIGFIMGVPFALGIKFLSENYNYDIPWAWAFNGYFSVLGSILAMVLAVEMGYRWVMLLAVLVYLMVAFCSYATPKIKSF